MKLKTITASIAALGLAATAAQAVQAAEPEQTSSIAAPGTDLSARRVVRDPQTGKLRAPTDDELQAMEAADRATRQAKGLPEDAGPGTPLRVRQHASGMRSAVLGADYMVTLTAKRRADGSLQPTHAQPGHDHPVARDVRPTE